MENIYREDALQKSTAKITDAPPKEKARELVEKYAIWSWNETICDYDVAKQCAKIAVDECLHTCVESSIYYWKEVLTEIENI